MEDGQQNVAAFIEERVVPGAISIVSHENEAGKPARVELQQYVGPTGGPGQYMFAKVSTLHPDMAIQLGEEIAAAGRSVKSSVEIPALGGIPSDLRGQG